MTELVTNAGSIFQEEGLHVLSDQLGLDEAELRERFGLIRDYFERRRGQLDKGASALETSFYFVNKTLHILGFTHSHNEPMTIGAHRPDYTLFPDADSFIDREPSRSTAQFFATAIAVMRVIPWMESFDTEGEGESEEEIEPGPDHPAFNLDELLRHTGLQWGLLTNGSVWRLYHRSTSGLLTTYYEVNLREILETNDFDAFRYFIGIFAKEALDSSETGACLAQQILN